MKFVLFHVMLCFALLFVVVFRLFKHSQSQVHLFHFPVSLAISHPSSALRIEFSNSCTRISCPYSLYICIPFHLSPGMQSVLTLMEVVFADINVVWSWNPQDIPLSWWYFLWLATVVCDVVVALALHVLVLPELVAWATLSMKLLNLSFWVTPGAARTFVLRGSMDDECGCLFYGEQNTKKAKQQNILTAHACAVEAAFRSLFRLKKSRNSSLEAKHWQI